MATSKKNGSKNGSKKTSSAYSKRRAELERKQRRNTISIALLLSGMVFFILTLLEGGDGWNTVRGVLFGLFGVFSYGVGPILLVAAFLTAYDKRVKGTKISAATFTLLAADGAIYIFGNTVMYGDTVGEKLHNLFLTGADGIGGGVLSALFGWPLTAFCGPVVAKILIVLLIVFFVMLWAGITVADLFDFFKRIASKTKDRAEQVHESHLDALERREQEKHLAEKAAAKKDSSSVKTAVRSRIDIPLDGDLDESSVHAGRSPIDVPIDNSDPIVLPKVPPSRYKEPASRIDIPLGPDPDPNAEKKGEEFPFVAKGPAAQLVNEVAEEVERDKKAREELFADFCGTAQAETMKRAGATTFGEEALGKVRQDAELKDADAANDEAGAGQQYRFPPMTLLKRAAVIGEEESPDELRANAELLIKTLQSFGVQTRLLNISRGPTVTRYELQPEVGVRLNRITKLADDIKLNLAAAEVRIEAPIPNKAAVGIEVPNKRKSAVMLRSVLESKEFRGPGALTVALGMDIGGNKMVTDIAKMPHLLIAGTTGSGKSICLHSMIISLLYKYAPQDLKFIMIDPKMVEFGRYNGIPHLLVPVVTDPKKSAGALGWAVSEMLKRYRAFSEFGVRDIDGFNKMVGEGFKGTIFEDMEEVERPRKMPRIVIVIDELADLMMAAPNEVEDSICRLAQMARAAGLHLIIATQRPSVNVITGVIKANISSRIALSVSSQIDSRTILDQGGAEKLLGKGDMLFLPMDLPKPVRIQGCYVSDEEIAKVIDFISTDGASYDEGIEQEIERNSVKDNGKRGSASGRETEEAVDEMLDVAISTVIEAGQASTSLLQRKLKLGYSRAARIMDEMEERGIISPPEGSKPRQVRITLSQWQEMRLARDTRDEF